MDIPTCHVHCLLGRELNSGKINISTGHVSRKWVEPDLALSTRIKHQLVQECVLSPSKIVLIILRYFESLKLERLDHLSGILVASSHKLEGLPQSYSWH